MTLRTLNYGNYGIFLIMGNAGFCPSAVGASSFRDEALSNQRFGLFGGGLGFRDPGDMSVNLRASETGDLPAPLHTRPPREPNTP